MTTKVRTSKVTVSGTGAVGVGFGCVLAITMSWTAHHAIFWACIHGLLGWFYVVYYLITKDGWTFF